ncbi:3-dehydroquinate synthase [Streptomyces sp. AA0539]|uniref:3-dehydroquinate synthase n=1 Tax=Streptomyces sp. AA0539 TaxID=1210045 RepID=UPI0003134FA1|nr:3-dehydroquinate synthase [Streptomyces sp. AA0539]
MTYSGHFSDAIPLSAGSSIEGVARRTDRYPVYVADSEASAVKYLLQAINGRRTAVICDDTVEALHGQSLARLLVDNGLDVAVTSIPQGEAHKSLETAARLLDWLANSAMARRDVIVAMGGGVVIDTVGWVASAYMRGMSYINVPTTLLAQVDAAIGGKVAVDHAAAKNLVGAFHQPRAVVSNVGYLNTLAPRQLRAGLAEAIKKGVIASPELYAFIERGADDLLAGDPVTTETLVRGASAIKCALISRDPYEEDLRRPLNFGHTVGHAVETVTGYGPVLHGEAVALGMTVAIAIAERRGVTERGELRSVVELLARTGLPVSLRDLSVEVHVDDVTRALGQIRKIRDGSLRFVLPVRLGECLIADDVSDAEIRAALRHGA